MPLLLLAVSCGGDLGPPTPGDTGGVGVNANGAAPGVTQQPSGAMATQTAPTAEPPPTVVPAVTTPPVQQPPVATAQPTAANTAEPAPVDGAGLGAINEQAPVAVTTPPAEPPPPAETVAAPEPEPPPVEMPMEPEEEPPPTMPGGFPTFPMGGGDPPPSGTMEMPMEDPPEPSGAPVELDCNAAMPSSGAQQHSGNGVGGDGNLAWEIWSNTGRGELTTYDVPAFSAIWNEAGGYLGRLGYEWGAFGDTPVPYENHGTIIAQFASTKTGTAGQYSYVGMYGWSTNPCIEWYVVDDSYNQMPINPGNTTPMGEVDIDGGTYIMYTRPTTGTGGTRCSGENDWMQYYSVRRTARACGQISLTEHFDAWKSLNMPLGDLLEAKIIVEVGGGTGRVDLPVANVIVTP